MGVTGRIAWNKGLRGVYHPTEETKQKQSKTTKGRPGVKGRPAWNKGKKGVYHTSEPTKQKLSKAFKGRKTWNKGLSKETNESMAKASRSLKGRSAWNKGKKCCSSWNKGLKGVQVAWNKGLKGVYHSSSETKLKQSNSLRGHPGIIAGRAKQIFPYNDSSIEVVFQNELTNKNIVFERQKLFYLSNGRCHRVDLFIPPNICIEADGCWFHACLVHCPRGNYGVKLREKNDFITQDLQNQGFIVLRFWEHDICERFDYCMKIICSTIAS